MKNLKTIYFVYDADGGVLNEITYWIDKNILNKKNRREKFSAALHNLRDRKRNDRNF